MHRFFSTLLFCACLFLTILSVNAAPIVVDQTWYRTISGSTFPSNELKTSASFDDSLLTGVGSEQLSLTRFSLTWTLDGVGQIFAVADTPEIMVAQYNDGDFRFIGANVGSGNGNVLITNQIAPDDKGNAGGIAFNPNIGRLTWNLPVSGSWNYALQNTVITNLLPPTEPEPESVPEPSILALMGIGLAGIGFARRRYRTI